MRCRASDGLTVVIAFDLPIPVPYVPPPFFPHAPFGRKLLLRILIWAMAGSAALILVVYVLAVSFPFR